MEVIEENRQNYLIRNDSGTTEIRSKSSNLNTLIYGHNLFGLLEEESEIWVKETDEEKITITPLGDNQYKLETDFGQPLVLGAERKTLLIDALAEVYDDHDGESVEPLLRLYRKLRKNMGRPRVLDPFITALSEKVERLEDGVLINGHLKLTFDNEFYHPRTVSTKRRGSTVVPRQSGERAYHIKDSGFNREKEKIERKVTVNGEKYRLTEKEVTFIVYMMWGIENTPDLR
jgi:hypothetical protein